MYMYVHFIITFYEKNILIHAANLLCRNACAFIIRLIYAYSLVLVWILEKRDDMIYGTRFHG